MNTIIVFEGLFIFEVTSRIILAKRAFVSVRTRENDIYPLFCKRKVISLLEGTHVIWLYSSPCLKQSDSKDLFVSATIAAFYARYLPLSQITQKTDCHRKSYEAWSQIFSVDV
jgi:hypothetical protein